MSQIIPEKPNGVATAEVARVFHTLKALPDDWRVWFHVAPWEPEAPDFLMLGPDGGALILKVSQATPAHAQQAPQLQLLALEMETAVPGEPEEQSLRSFLKAIIREGVPSTAVAAAVIFPNLKQRDFRAIEQSGTEPKYTWLDKTWVGDRGPDAWRDLFPAEVLDPYGLQLIRTQFTPEAVVPTAFTARSQPESRRHDDLPALGDFLLDYNQEAILKTDLDLVAADTADSGPQAVNVLDQTLSAAAELLSRNFRAQVVNGVAGSGKTLILLYRLRLLQEMFPHKAYQVLTHNRPLIRDMQARYNILNPAGCSHVRWNTFMQWCHHNWPRGRSFDILPDRRRTALVRSVWAEHLNDTGVSERMFDSELGWLKDRGLARLEDYLAASRRGRGFRLPQQQRAQMFAAMQVYQVQLQRQGMMDWWDVPRRFWHWMEEGKITPPKYDVVLVDEAQFFAPLWFDIIRQMVIPTLGYLFLAADPTQGFLRRGESWRAIAGMEIRGRSHILRRSYRTTRAILALALAFYRQRLPEDEPDLVRPDLRGMVTGEPPVLLRFSAPQDERTGIVREIAQAVGQGLPRRDILILHASGSGAAAIIDALNENLGDGAARDPKSTMPGNFIRVTTFNAGTGLESPVVFVVGLDTLFEREESLRLDDDDRADLVREHTRKLYMAFTRAGQRLVLTMVGSAPASLQELEKYGLLHLA